VSDKLVRKLSKIDISKILLDKFPFFKSEFVLSVKNVVVIAERIKNGANYTTYEYIIL